MKDLSYEALVKLVTEEVIKLLESGNSTSSGGASCARPFALVIGDKANLPAAFCEKYALADLDSYKGDVSGYECVIAAELSCAQLADAALGRDSSSAACAITKAFLSGKKVCILESGLPHRAFRETANRNFYAMLEGYVNTLRSFGAEIIREQWNGKDISCNAIADNSVDKVVTEKLALSLCESACGGTINLKRGTVITPSAKDIFNHSGVSVEFVD